MRGLGAAGKAAGAENGRRWGKGDLQPVEELADGGLVRSKEARRLGLQFEVEIADGPADAGGRGGREVEGDLDDGLGKLLDGVARGGGLKKRVAVLERRGEFKTELGAVCGRAAPEAFRQREPFGAQGDFGERGISRRERAGNELHEGSEAGSTQNKK